MADFSQEELSSLKAEARLNEAESNALTAYMRDRFLTNRSEVLRSALGQFLVREGYLELPATVKAAGSEAVIITDTEGRVTTIDRAFSKMCGYSLKELRGKKPGDVLRPKTLDAELPIVSEFRRAILKQQPFECTLTNYHKSGRPYRVEIKMEPIFKGRELTGFKARERRVSSK